MHFWAECINPNVLCQLLNPDRGLRTGRSVVRAKAVGFLFSHPDRKPVPLVWISAHEVLQVNGYEASIANDVRS